jgi:hypothetical protein
MVSNSLDSRGGAIHHANAPQCHVTTVLKLFFIIDINFTNAHILGLRKLESCRQLTACPYMDLGPSSIVFLEATKVFLQISNYTNNLFIYMLNILWYVTGEKKSNKYLRLIEV